MLTNKTTSSTTMFACVGLWCWFFSEVFTWCTIPDWTAITCYPKLSFILCICNPTGRTVACILAMKSIIIPWDVSSVACAILLSLSRNCRFCTSRFWLVMTSLRWLIHNRTSSQDRRVSFAAIVIMSSEIGDPFLHKSVKYPFHLVTVLDCSGTDVQKQHWFAFDNLIMVYLPYFCKWSLLLEFCLRFQY